MAGAKETPRQKMIGMMYLVLTALLALNVSSDILNSFVIVDESIMKTSENATKKNQILYNAFEASLIENKAKVQKYYDKAMEAKKLSDELVKFIWSVRTDLIAQVEGIPKEIADTISTNLLKKKDNFDLPTHIMCGTDEADGGNGQANEIKKKIIEYKEKVSKLVDAKERKNLNLGLEVEGKFYNSVMRKSMTWELNNFYHVVSVGAVVVLDKIIVEVKNAESEVVSKLREEITAGDFKFDKIEAKVVPKSRFVIAGDKYTADIFVAAYSSTDTPQVLIGDYDTAKGEFRGVPDKLTGSAGIVKYEVPAGGEGPRKYSGVINIKTPSGQIKPYPFASDYVVSRPMATVSAEKMNVFYIGLVNPVSVSVPGVAPSEVTVGISGGGSIKSKGGGKYDVTVPMSAKEISLNVVADMGDAKRNMGSFKFRVKRVPKPQPKVAGKEGGAITKGALTGAPIVSAELADFLFDGVSYAVTGFSITVPGSGGLLQEEATVGNRISGKAIGWIKKAKPGTKVYIENIRARGPDGQVQNIGSITLKLS